MTLYDDLSFYVDAAESPLDLVKVLIIEFLDDCTTTLDMSTLPDGKNFEILEKEFRAKHYEKLKKGELEFH